MSSFKKSKPQMARAVSLVQKIKDVTNELVLVISQDDRLNKYRFDSAINDRANIVECAKKRYESIGEEFDRLNEQLDFAKGRLHELDEKYKCVIEENTSLINAVQTVKCEDCLCENDLKECNDSRLKLKLYKKMTGVHFDINAAGEELTGFIGIKGDGQHQSGLVPFILTKDIDTCLWEKIGEALHT